MIDRGWCWRYGCTAPTTYLIADRVGVALCDWHAAEVAGAVVLTPIESRVDLAQLTKRDLPRSPA